MGYAQRKEILWQTFRGWIGYFKYADMRSLLIPLDQGIADTCVCVYGNVGRE